MVLFPTYTEVVLELEEEAWVSTSLEDVVVCSSSYSSSSSESLEIIVS